MKRNSATSGLQRIDSAVRSWNSKTPSNVTPDPDRRAIHSYQSGFSSGATPTCIPIVIRVYSAAPERITALECEHGLWNVGLHVDYGSSIK